MNGREFVNGRIGAPLPSRGVAVLCAGVCIAAPTALRASVDPIVAGTTYGTYYPFVLIAALFLGWQYAAVVTLIAAVLGDFLFVEPKLTFFPSAGERFAATLFMVSSAMIIVTGNILRRNVAQLHSAREREAHLNRELQHRVKNTLAVVQGLVAQSFRGSSDAKAALHKLQGRLKALADANDILRDGQWTGCRLPDLAIRALEPFNSGGAITLTGPECSLPQESCVPLVLALHELATNAVKYGALSNDLGNIEIEWQLKPASNALSMTWSEKDGPAVVESTHRGFGSRLLRPQHGLTSVVMSFLPAGLKVELALAGVHAVSAAQADRHLDPAAAALYSSSTSRSITAEHPSLVAR